jgi:hypothetical protein
VKTWCLASNVGLPKFSRDSEPGFRHTAKISNVALERQLVDLDARTHIYGHAEVALTALDRLLAVNVDAA